MSRILIKNLPNHITEDRLRKIFSEKSGTITDLKLLHSAQGKFRKMAFIGFNDINSAQQSIDYFDNSFIDTSRITVEPAKSVNDPTLPRPWSKYSTGSSANSEEKNRKNKVQRILRNLENPKLKNSISKKSKNKIASKKNTSNAVDEIEQSIFSEVGINQQNADQFKEFMALHDIELDKRTILNGCTDLNSKEGSDTGQISDIDQQNQDEGEKYTIRVTNLSQNIKLKRILKFFIPLKIIDARLLPSTNKKNPSTIAFLDFKTEQDMQKAIKMSGSVLKTRTINIQQAEYKDLSVHPNTYKNTNNNSNIVDGLDNNESILDTGRLFIRNLPFNCDEILLKETLNKFGPVVDFQMPINKQTNTTFGLAYITYMMPEHAIQAYNQLDGTIFCGRLMHVLPATTNSYSEYMNSGNFKNDRLNKLKQSDLTSYSDLNPTGNHPSNWNSLFLRADAVANLAAKRLNLDKNELLINSRAPAVNLAIAETSLVDETKQFLVENGINLEAFSINNIKKSNKVILLKNLPDDVQYKELKDHITLRLATKFNIETDSSTQIVDTTEQEIDLPRIILPPFGLSALLEFPNSFQAKKAFKRLAYSRKQIPLDNQSTTTSSITSQNQSTNERPVSGTENKQIIDTSTTSSTKNVTGASNSTVIYVKNLNFKTDEETLMNHFSTLGKVIKVLIAKKKSRNELQSLGYGFVEFEQLKTAREAILRYQNSVLDNNRLELKLTITSSNNNNNTGKDADSEAASKIMVRNVPFEANITDLYELFKSYGNLKKVRLPRKMNVNASGSGSGSTNQHRGFAFVEFVSNEDAKNCFDALSLSTHLYGRRLVLEWADDSSSDINQIRKRTIAHFDSQHNKKSNKTLLNGIMDTLENDTA